MVVRVLAVLEDGQLPVEVIGQGHGDIVDVVLAHDALASVASGPPQYQSHGIVSPILINSARPRPFDVGHQRVRMYVVAQLSNRVIIEIAELDVGHVLHHRRTEQLDTIVSNELAHGVRQRRVDVRE